MFIFVLAVPLAPFTLGMIAYVNSMVSRVSFALMRDPDMVNAGMVNIVDVSYLLFDFGAVIGSSRYRPQADLDADGIVGIIDYSVVTYSYGAPVFS
jgi:hypothetical protein